MLLEVTLTREQIERNVAAGRWQNRLVNDYLREAVERHPEKRAVTDSRGVLSFGELGRLTEEAALGFLELGLRPGDVVRRAAAETDRPIRRISELTAGEASVQNGRELDGWPVATDNLARQRRRELRCGGTPGRTVNGARAPCQPSRLRHESEERAWPSRDFFVY